jgi:hypothetical protein
LDADPQAGANGMKTLLEEGPTASICRSVSTYGLSFPPGSGAKIATDVDAVVVANAALEQMGFSYRLQPLH